MLFGVFLTIAFSLNLSAKDLYFEGYTYYDFYQNQPNSITLTVDKIYNARNARTGTLKVQLWAMSYPYDGGYINGYVVAETTLGELYPNRYYGNVSRSVPFVMPPPGRYFMTMVLAEFQHNGQYQTIDWINYKRKERF